MISFENKESEKLIVLGPFLIKNWSDAAQLNRDFNNFTVHTKTMWTKAPVALQGDEKQFTRFTSSPLCSYSSRCHKSSEVNNYVMNLEVQGKVDILMGLASASMKYRHRDESSSKREVMSLSSAVFARKGFLFPSKGSLKYSDKGMDFNVEGIEIGMEDILIVTSEYER